MGQPIKEFRDGEIRIVLWENVCEGEKSYNFSINRGYPKKDKTWFNSDPLYASLANIKSIIAIGQAMISNKIIKGSKRIEKKVETPPPQKLPVIKNKFQGESVSISDEDIPF